MLRKITFTKDRWSCYYFRAAFHKAWASGCNPEGCRCSSFADGKIFFHPFYQFEEKIEINDRLISRAVTSEFEQTRLVIKKIVFHCFGKV